MTVTTRVARDPTSSASCEATTTVTPEAAASTIISVEDRAGRRVETGVGLVEQPQLGPPGGQHGQGHPPALTGRELGGRGLGQAAGQSQAITGVADPGRVRPRRPHREAHVLAHGEVVVEMAGMGQQAHPAAHPAPLTHRVQAEHPHLARGQWHQAGADPQQAGLAGPVRPLDQHRLPGGDLEVDTGEEREASRQGDRVTEENCWGGRGWWGHGRPTCYEGRGRGARRAPGVSGVRSPGRDRGPGPGTQLVASRSRWRSRSQVAM